MDTVLHVLQNEKIANEKRKIQKKENIVSIFTNISPLHTTVLCVPLRFTHITGQIYSNLIE